MAKLWFQDHRGQERVIADCETLNDVYAEIDKFIADANDRWPEKRKFQRLYTRVWKENDRWKFDVGSWSEFFYWESPKAYEELERESRNE